MGGIIFCIFFFTAILLFNGFSTFLLFERHLDIIIRTWGPHISIIYVCKTYTDCSDLYKITTISNNCQLGSTVYSLHLRVKLRIPTTPKTGNLYLHARHRARANFSYIDFDFHQGNLEHRSGRSVIIKEGVVSRIRLVANRWRYRLSTIKVTIIILDMTKHY